jgi:hypothetical protein
MADQTGGPGIYTGTGNIFDGVGTGSYTLEGDALLGLGGNAGATVTTGTIAQITIGLNIAGIGVAALSNVTITAAGGEADIESVIGAVLGVTTLNAIGGTVSIGSAVTALSAVQANIQQGGTFEAYSSLLSALSSSDVNFGPGGGSYVIESSGLSLNVLSGVTINGFTSGDTIVDDNVTGASVASYSIGTDGTVTFFSGANETGAIGGLKFAAGTFTVGDYATGSGPLLLSSAAGALQIELSCFLRGVRIATPQGECAVEALSVGDLVAVHRDGRTCFEPVVWIGRRQVDVHALGKAWGKAWGDALDAYPVRIRAHAFAENAPHRDLLLTSEHCVLADGRLVPVRMLVNGGSIAVDRSIPRYEYFHIELERHSILLAEGLETESYIDTGNRGNFANAEIPSMIPSFAVAHEHKSWEHDAAAPLAVDRETVEPIWARLNARAQAMGIGGIAAPAALDSDPGLHLVSETGLRIAPVLCDGTTYGFVVPAGVRSLRLASRAARPSDCIGPYLDDRRTLGVLVGKIGAGAGRDRAVLTAHLEGEALPGWHGQEPDSPGRWTDGSATLPLDQAALGDGEVYLDIEIVHAGPYPALRPSALAA